jgi:hypothetical protein
MITLDFKAQYIGTKYLENLEHLPIGEELKITGFKNKNELINFVLRKLIPSELNEDVRYCGMGANRMKVKIEKRLDYTYLINEKELSYTVTRVE